MRRGEYNIFPQLFASCLCASLHVCECLKRLSLTLLSDGLDCHGWSDYEKVGIGSNICQQSENDYMFTEITP